MGEGRGRAEDQGRVEQRRGYGLLLFLHVAVEDNRRPLLAEGLPACQRVAAVLHS